MLRPLLTGAGVLLGAFHLWLFGQQAWTGQLEYAESVRWLTAAGLVCGLALLQSQGASLVRGRRATAIWVLAALLHGPALAEEATLANQAVSEAAGVASQLLGAAAGLALVLAVASARRRWSQRPSTQRAFVSATAPHVPVGAFVLGFSPRPPPRSIASPR